MSQFVDQLTKAQNYAMSIRPKVGGFPVLAEVLRQAEIKLNRWFLPSCQSIYFLKDGAVVQQGSPLACGTYEIPKFNQKALIAAIRADQEGRSSFVEFLQAIWDAGVVTYDVNFMERRVLYFGINGESYIEDYPAIELEAKI